MKDGKSWSGLFGQREDQAARVLPFRPREKALLRQDSSAREEEPAHQEPVSYEETVPREETAPREETVPREEAVPREETVPQKVERNHEDVLPLRGSRTRRLEDPPAEFSSAAAATSQSSWHQRPDVGETSGPERIPEPTPLRPRADVTHLRRHRGARLRRSRRSLFLRLVRPFLLALAIVGAPLALAVWFLRSPVFAFSELEISSDQGGRVSETWVREALESARGWNLPRLPLPWIDNALKHHSWVQATALRKELPNRLYIQVIERREVAILLQDDAEDGRATFWYLDSNGTKIARYEPTDGEIDLPIISVNSPERDARGALALLEEMDQTVTEDMPLMWTRGLSEIEVLGEQDFRVWTADLPFPLLVRSGTLTQKTPYLEELLPEIVRRYEGIAALDLRFAGKIILQPKRLG